MTDKEKHEETRQELEKEEELLEEKEEVEENEKLEKVSKKAAKKIEKRVEKEIVKGKKTEEEVEEETAEEIEDAEQEEKEKEERRARAHAKSRERRGRRDREGKDLSEWVPKTKLGKEVASGKYKDIKDVLSSGEIILEPEIVDYMVPELKEELIYIGGTPGKGGGARRTPTRMTARMHKSGRRFKLTALMIVGNEDGVVGIGRATSSEHRVAIEKSLAQAKLNVINVKRGCGSWECNCGRSHSIPYKTSGKAGSVRIMLSPTPTGVGIVADNETKKILRLAGIKDVWIKAFGMTSTRVNLAFAVFDALRNLSNTKGDI